MPVTDYRPAVGETLFVSLSGNLPFLITVTGYHYHSYLEEDVMDFEYKDGKTNWTSLDNNTYYTEISPDTPYLYIVMREIHPYSDGGSDWEEEAFFFAPDQAFAHLDTVASSDECIVEVRRLN